MYLLPSPLPGHSEYNTDNIYDKSPQDVVMASPEETSYKNILISIRDKPSIIDETITVKRAKKSILSHTDTITPIDNLKPKMAYIDKVSPSYVPGKAVKIVSDVTHHSLDKVGVEAHSLDSLSEYYLNQRRLSEGSGEKPPKKRCSTSTIRKLRPDEMKKSKSEVSKLCDKVKSIKLKDESKNYKTRSCNDIVKLILTKHGIHVISDTEAIV
ncbi:unnamed protein product [Leptosia nina]|uniref:Uncharacterized protein n=1 Tax=Leptosia nina TaxID=320188 RepID=A0AAV1IWD0_9NEOP